jgi:hypothetical protein
MFSDGYEIELEVPDCDDEYRLIDFYSLIQEMELEHGYWVNIKKSEKYFYNVDF